MSKNQKRLHKSSSDLVKTNTISSKTFGLKNVQARGQPFVSGKGFSQNVHISQS